MGFCDMPAPAPPPRLALRSADVHAGVPDAAGLELVAPEVLAPAGAAGDAEDAEDAALFAEARALEAPDGELAEAAVEDVDDAAHPAASTPAARSGTTS